LLFLGLAALFYAPLLLGLRTFPDGDFTHHFLPFGMFQQQEMLAGRLPLWNPYTYSGHPFLADVQAAVFYPLSTLLLLLTLPWHEAGARLYFLQVEAVLQIALGGLFTYLLANGLTGSRWGGVLAGITFAFSGYLTGYPPLQLAVLRTAIWLPLLLWLLLRLHAEPLRWRWWLGTGACLATAFLAGHSQTFLYIAYTSAAWAALLLLLRWRTVKRRERIILALALALSGLLALGLAAAQLLPSVEFVRLSVRSNVEYAFVAGGFPLQDTWQMLLPAVLTQFSPLYVGVVSLGLAFLGAWFVVAGRTAVQPRAEWRPSPRAGAAFFLGLAAVALLLAYGGNGFLYPLFYAFAPGWNLFRGQERAAFLVVVGLSVLAGYGALALGVMPLRLRAWWATAFAALMVGATYLFGLLWQLPGRTAIGEGSYLLLAAMTVTLASVFAVLLRQGGWSTRRTLWLLGLTAANLFVVNMGTNLSEFGPARKTLLAPEVQAVQAAVAGAPVGDVGLPGRVYNEFRTYEDYGMRVGVEDVWGASPLRLAHYAALFEEFPLDRMWELLGVAHVLTWRKELFGPSELLGEFPQAADTTYLHRLPAPHPRAWLVRDMRFATDEEARALLSDHQFDITQTALIAAPMEGSAGQLGPDGPRSTAPGGGGAVQVARRSPASFAVTVQDSPGALLVVAENWMPGWRVENVTCTGGCATAPLPEPALGLPAFAPQRTNLALLGIPVPPGSYRFDLVYAPDSVRLGLWLSGATLLSLLVLIIGRLLWRRKAHAPGTA
jgi:hypothetical protein